MLDFFIMFLFSFLFYEIVQLGKCAAVCIQYWSIGIWNTFQQLYTPVNVNWTLKKKENVSWEKRVMGKVLHHKKITMWIWIKEQKKIIMKRFYPPKKKPGQGAEMGTHKVRKRAYLCDCIKWEIYREVIYWIKMNQLTSINWQWV